MDSGPGGTLAQQPRPVARVPDDPRVVAALTAVRPALELPVFLIGSVVLVGWAVDVAFLKSVLPALATMKANTALGFVLAAASLHLSRQPSAPRARDLLGRTCGVAVLLLGLVTLGEYATGWDAGIDQILFEDVRSAVTAHPGRMSPLTAF